MPLESCIASSAMRLFFIFVLAGSTSLRSRYEGFVWGRSAIRFPFDDVRFFPLLFFAVEKERSAMCGEERKIIGKRSGRLYALLSGTAFRVFASAVSG